MRSQDFNRIHAVGMPVFLIMDNGNSLETYLTSKAWELGDGTAVAKVDGVRGGYDVSRIKPRFET